MRWRGRVRREYAKCKNENQGMAPKRLRSRDVNLAYVVVTVTAVGGAVDSSTSHAEYRLAELQQLLLCNNSY